MYHKRVRLLGFLLIAVMICAGPGCAWLQRSPEQSPLPKQAAPNKDTEQAPAPQAQIPKAISQGKKKEPQLRVYMAKKGAVETVQIEDYIQGVVAAEMDPTWPQAALAAQAIIARSFTLQKIAENGGVPNRNAHASTDIKEFQAYDASRINDNVRKAVAATRGQAAVYGDEFIRGWFHAYAGPRTAMAKEGLEFKGANPPYIRIVDSPAEDVIPEEEKKWQESFPLSRIRKVTREITGKDPGAVKKMEIAQKGPSGRVVRFRVNDVEVSGPQLRLALDSTVMRSTFVEELKISGDKVTMKGSGYGHGVGMCQWGARGLAEDGKSAEEIVKYYYRNIEIVKLWE
ncbi:MAG TPA: SpoIID/LytB domain-containing protein [Oscillospiraceae bacterium]|nr:SpoIID/LytB domain-containing protein [Oscillospiraceae bacterium]